METIMVQESDTATLEVVTAALQMEGYRVCSPTAYSENMLELIRRYRPKAVLLDCWLSNYSGKRMCQWIKSHFPQLPVIAFSCDEGINAQYRSLGFDDYINKPFDLDRLYQVVRKQIIQPKKHRIIKAAV